MTEGTNVSMISGLSIRHALAAIRIVPMVMLTASWCALWQTISVANILSGAVVSAAALAVGGGMLGGVVGDAGTPDGLGRGGWVRPVAFAKLLWLVFVDLVTSTVAVAREVLTPTDYTTEDVISVTVEPEARRHLLLMVVAITLTPGTAVVEADPKTGEMLLHILYREDADDVTAHTHNLARLAVEAFPTPSPRSK